MTILMCFCRVASDRQENVDLETRADINRDLFQCDGENTCMDTLPLIRPGPSSGIEVLTRLHLRVGFFTEGRPVRTGINKIRG